MHLQIRTPQDYKPHSHLPPTPTPNNHRNPSLRLPLPPQKLLLLPPTLLQIDKPPKPQKTDQTQREKKVKRHAIILRRAGVNDSRRNQRPDERRSLADDAEEAEEEELFPAGGHFADHDLAVGVPGADEEAVEGLVEPDCECEECRLVLCEFGGEVVFERGESLQTYLPKHYGSRISASKSRPFPRRRAG